MADWAASPELETDNYYLKYMHGVLRKLVSNARIFAYSDMQIYISTASIVLSLRRFSNSYELCLFMNFLCRKLKYNRFYHLCFFFIYLLKIYDLLQIGQQKFIAESDGM